MSALTITMSTSTGWVLGLTLIGVGAFLQYFAGLELDDRADAKEQDRDAILNATAPAPPLRDCIYGCHTNRGVTCEHPRTVFTSAFLAQRDGGAS